MNWAEIGVATTFEAMDAVVQIMLDIGCGGAVVSGVSSPFVTAYLPVNDALEPKVAELKARVVGLKEYGLDPGSADVMLRSIADEDWAEAWKAYFKPMRIGKRLVIKPSWESLQPGENDVIVEIDPGQAFGTGTHPSTQLALEALERYLKPCMVVYDIGTGSGILSIAAVRLGAGSVWATDSDPIAVSAASRNVAMNGVADRVHVAEAEGLPEAAENPHLALANIVAEVLAALCSAVYARLQPGGFYIASGIVDNKAPLVARALPEAGFKIIEILSEGEWVAFVAGKGF
ncbi:MAG: 50S ribosomal protein L11 methyltransferase [Armatimonadetes bacterium]|nr:50S ribosomal protein L11 methyltransferase [Armatimonadota bacterium]